MLNLDLMNNLQVLVLAVLADLVASHGAMTFPRPRAAQDGDLAPWTQWAYPCDAGHKGSNCAITFCENGKDCQGSCPVAAKNGHPNALNASNGQSCYWFSNGCTIGCNKCDGTNNHLGHGNQKFRYKGMTKDELVAKNLTIDAWNPAPGDMVLDPATTKDLNPHSMCARPTTNATICDTRLRTVNTQAECGSPEDFYFYSPWRAPGSAPVIDACGSAGGRLPGQGIGGAGAQFENTSFARANDVGSALPAMPPQAMWAAGAAVEVGWTVMAHHGGGYAYRLAPAGGPLTEAVFVKTALPFVGPSWLRWDGDRSTQLEFDPKARGWETSEGTVPAGSSWRKLPVPTVLWEREGPSFEPVCNESEACRRAATANKGPAGACRCTGHSNGGPLLPNLEIVDKVQIPAGIAPGHYVLQFRWDCEETDQVWAQCADVEITSAAAALQAIAAAKRGAGAQACASFVPAPLLLDKQGRTVDARGNVVVPVQQSAPATLKANMSGGGGGGGANPYLAHRAGAGAGAGASAASDAGAGADDGDDADGAAAEGFDPRLRLKQRETRARKSFSFVKQGTYVKQGDSLRAREAGKMMAGFMSGRNPATRGAAGRGIAFVKEGSASASVSGGSVAVLGGPGEDELVLPPAPDDPIPECEWWDEAFLPAEQRKARAEAWKQKTVARLAGKAAAVAAAGGGGPAAVDSPAALASEPAFDPAALRLEHARAHALVEHPVAIVAAADLLAADEPAAQQVMLTKEERKRLRRQTRLEREREKQDKIALGLMPAPEPKVKISNMMRVLGEQAVADPSRVEKQVMDAVQQRQAAHDARNHARMLPKEERKAKNVAKMKAEGAGALGETHVAVFWVADLSCGQKRFKVDVNAQQNHLTGGVVTCASERLNLVVVEGGGKGVKRFTKLMTRRLNWAVNADDEREGEGADGSPAMDTSGPASARPPNTCELVWEGIVTKKLFNNFRFQECRSSETARKVLEAKGCAHYWDSITTAAAAAGQRP
eukprot:g3648.t1